MILKTERLLIRKIDWSDLSVLHNIMDEETMYAWEHAYSIDDVKEHIEKNLKRYIDHGIGFYTVILEETGEIIGQIGLMNSEDRISIGWIIGKNYWRHGYAFEGATAFLRYGFNELNSEEIYADIRPENISSIKLAEKLGMRQIGEYVKNYRGKDMPHNIYLIKKEEFNDKN